MDPGVKRSRRSVHKRKPDSVRTTQQELERLFSDKLDNYQPEAINSEMQANEEEILYGQWKKGQEFTCATTQQAAVNSLENRFFKVRQSTAGCITEQAMESLQRILAGEGLLKKDDAAVRPKYERNLDKQHFQNHKSQALHLPFSCFIQSNSTKTAESRSHPSQVILKDIAKCRERSRICKSSSLKGKDLDFFEVVKEQLQQKDLENQHLVHLLLNKQEELNDATEIIKQKEKEMQLVAEKLKCEEQRNAEITARFEQTCEDLRKELTEAKRDNKKSVKQLQALVEKYERLKMRAKAVKDQLTKELNEKKSGQKTVMKLKEITQELITKQKHLEEQRDAAAKDLTLCRQTLQMMDAEHKKNMSISQRLEEELSALRTESANLRDHLCKTQEKNKELIQLARFKEADKEKNLKESQDMIEKLNVELKKSRVDKDKVHQQVEAIKHESKLIHSKQRMEILQLQEQQEACLQQSDGLRRECKTLMEMANNLKMEKQILTEKLETIHNEKTVLGKASAKEGERLKEAIRLLERERKVLLKEMEDLRNDYVSISDRITQKMGHMDAADPTITITDITSNHQRKTFSPTDHVIQEIRRKLDEENIQQS